MISPISNLGCGKRRIEGVINFKMKLWQTAARRNCDFAIAPHLFYSAPILTLMKGSPPCLEAMPGCPDSTLIDCWVGEVKRTRLVD